MKRLLAFLVLILASLNAGSSPLAMNPMDRMIGFHNAAWQMACEAKKFDCTLIDPPHVAYTILPRGILGQYHDGTDVVLINMKLILNPASVAVAIHEMVHYLQNASGELDRTSPSYKGVCAVEHEAFDLTFAMNQKYHLVAGDFVQPWSQTFYLYGCPP